MIQRAILVGLLAWGLFPPHFAAAQEQPPLYTNDPLANYDPAQPPSTTEFTLGVGYANISIEGPFDSENALRWDPSLSISPLARLPQLRLGAAVPFSLVLDNSSRTIISNDGNLIITGSSDIPLWTLEPELRLSWRQYIGERKEFFIEPGVAGGALFAFVDIGDDEETAVVEDSYDESDGALSARVFLRAGIRASGGFAGLEASYLASETIDLAENASGQVEQWYIGIFGSLAF
jgi:hypothetical protein